MLIDEGADNIGQAWVAGEETALVSEPLEEHFVYNKE